MFNLDRRGHLASEEGHLLTERIDLFPQVLPEGAAAVLQNAAVPIGEAGSVLTGYTATNRCMPISFHRQTLPSQTLALKGLVNCVKTNNVDIIFFNIFFNCFLCFHARSNFHFTKKYEFKKNRLNIIVILISQGLVPISQRR